MPGSVQHILSAFVREPPPTPSLATVSCRRCRRAVPAPAPLLPSSPAPEPSPAPAAPPILRQPAACLIVRSGAHQPPAFPPSQATSTLAPRHYPRNSIPRACSSYSLAPRRFLRPPAVCSEDRFRLGAPPPTSIPAPLGLPAGLNPAACPNHRTPPSQILRHPAACSGDCSPRRTTLAAVSPAQHANPLPAHGQGVGGVGPGGSA
jgi:hypothetical protein